jgi:hypothetical protein
MLKESQRDALESYYKARIALKKQELEEYCDTSESTNPYWRPNEDAIGEMCDDIRRLEAELEDAECLEVQPAVEVPVFVPNKAAVFTANAAGIIGGVAIGMLLGAAIVFSDRDLFWNNAASFWSQVWGS